MPRQLPDEPRFASGKTVARRVRIVPMAGRDPTTVPVRIVRTTEPCGSYQIWDERLQDLAPVPAARVGRSGQLLERNEPFAKVAQLLISVAGQE